MIPNIIGEKYHMQSIMITIKYLIALPVILFSIALGQVTFQTLTITSDAGSAQAILSIDLDKDGDLDIVTLGGLFLAWYENDGSENFTTHEIPTIDLNGTLDLKIADINNDDELDLIIAASNQNLIIWYENDGSENFIPHEINTQYSWCDIDVGYIDSDNNIDIVAVANSDGYLYWFENDGAENFTPHYISLIAYGYAVDLKDINNDGAVDILTASSSDNSIRWFRNDGNQNFLPILIADDALMARDVFAVDLDEDGNMDILTGQRTDGLIRWFKNDGSENFTSYTIASDIQFVDDVHAKDIDGDGDLDIVSSGYSYINYIENDGEENFTPYGLWWAYTASKVISVDLDDSGTMDIIACSGGSISQDDNRSMYWYKNLSLPGCTDPIATNYNLFAIIDNNQCEYYTGPTWYVSTSGSDETGNGTEENPFATIQHGLNIASDNDTILVAAGTYTENIIWPATNGIKLLGEDRETTVIDGNLNGSVVTLSSANLNTTLDGFTITNGSAGYGGGLYINSSPQINNLIISSNSGSSGGGIYISAHVAPLITNTNIINNSAVNYGGGIYIETNYETPTFKNVLIANNTGAGLSCRWSSGIIASHLTIIGNTLNGLTVDGGGNFITLSNSIIRDNLVDVYNNSNESILSINNNINNIVGNISQWNNINIDPLFTDSENGDYTLTEYSHCIDTGTSDINNDGIDDITDFNGLAPDMGAFESEYTAIAGCSDPIATNYNPDAWIEEPCEYPDYSLYFNGTDEYVNCGTDASINISGDITVSAFIKTTHTEDNLSIIEKYYSGGNGWGIATTNNGQNLFFYGRTVDGGFEAVASPIIINDGNWHHVVITRAGSEWSIIIDGHLTSQTNSDGSFSNGNPLVFGQEWSNISMYPYNGYLDNVGIWDRALTDEEIESITYGDFDATSISNLAGYWDFDVNVQDLSGNENHGQLNGTSWSLTDITPGCTDPLAENYSSNVNLNDGSCEYYDNYALDFDGIDDYVTIADSDDWWFAGDDFAIQLWAKFDEYTSPYRPLVGQSAGGHRNLINQRVNDFPDVIEGDNIIMYQFTQGYGNYRYVATEFSPEFDQWYHLTITRNNGTFQWLINGEPVETHLITGSTESDIFNEAVFDNIGAPFEFGRHAYYDLYFNGNLDEIAIFKHGLDSEDILSNILVGIDLEDDDLMGYWKLDDAPGNELIDSSTYGNDGDITGAEWTADVPIAGCSDPEASNYTEGSNTTINCLYNTGPDWYVTVDGDDVYNDGSEDFPFATINHAVNQIQTDSTGVIHVGVGTFTENITIENKNITIIGQGPENTIIDGNGVRVFALTSDAFDHNNISISDLLIINGHNEIPYPSGNGNGGGGILAEGVNLILDNVIMTGNSVSGGQGQGSGAIQIYYSDAIIRNSLIYDNHNTTEGWGEYKKGGVQVLASRLLIENSTIVENGEVSLHLDFGSTVNIINSIIEINNPVDDDGWDNIFGPNNYKELNITYSNIVSQPETALIEFDELTFSLGSTNFDHVTYYSVELDENYNLVDGSYGIDAGTQSFEFDPISGWSGNWPESEQDAHLYMDDLFNNGNPDLGWQESPYTGVGGCNDPLAQNYNPVFTFEVPCSFEGGNYALNFNPDNDVETESHGYSEVSPFDIGASNEISITAWINAETFEDEFDMKTIACQYDDYGAGTMWNFGILSPGIMTDPHGDGSGGGLVFYLPGKAGVASEVVGVIPQEDFHVAATYKEGVVNFYVNGVKESIIMVDEEVGLETVDAKICLGTRCQWGDTFFEFEGILDEVTLWDRAISDDEVSIISKGEFDPLNEPNLYSYWKFDNPYDITISDESGNNNDLTLSRLDEQLEYVSFSHEDTYGCMDPIATNYDASNTFNENCEYNANYALEFDGVDDWVNLGNSMDLNPELFTIITWIKPGDGLSQGLNGGPIITRAAAIEEDNVNYCYVMDIMYNDNNSIIFTMSDTDGNFYQYIGGSGIIDINQWHNVSITFDGSLLRLYIDGVLQDGILYMNGDSVEAVLGTPYQGDFNTQIGSLRADSPPSYFYLGSVDNTQIWSRALSQEEIQQSIYEENYGSGDESLVGHWSFNDGTGPILSDLSSYGNDGNINGATWTNDVPIPGCSLEDASNYVEGSNTFINCLENPAGPVWYVSTDGDDVYNDGSVDYPFASIQHGLNTAASGDSILVASGTYYENIIWPATANLKLIGEDQETTIIDGNQNGTVIEYSSGVDSNTIMKGFTIQNGNASGIWISDSYPSLIDLIIRNNSAGNGGGLYLRESNSILENVAIIGNSADNDGGGLYCYYNSDPTLKNITITNNSASRGNGMFIKDDSNPSIINCILWGDSPQYIYFSDYYDLNSVSIAYSIIQGGMSSIIESYNSQVHWSEGNLNTDPLFNNPDNGDYTLQWGSPAINVGDPLSGTDPDGSYLDMGAFPFDLYSGAIRTGTVIINELMIDPLESASDVFYEYFEIYNPSDQAIWLHEWTLDMNVSSPHNMVAPNLIIHPDEYMVFARSDSSSNGGFSEDYIYWNMVPFDNSSATLYIYDINVNIVDEVTYGSDYGFPDIVPTESLELILPEYDNDDGNNWGRSVEYYNEYNQNGTPGMANSTIYNRPTANAMGSYEDTDQDGDGQETLILEGWESADLTYGYIEQWQWILDGEIIFSDTLSEAEVEIAVGDHELVLKVIDDDNLWDTDTTTVTVYPRLPMIVINEIMQDTDGAGIVDDAAGEYIELFNLDDVPVDISGWTLESNSGTHTFSNETPEIPAQSYFLLARSSNWGWATDITPDYVYGDILLDDISDKLILRTPLNQTVDSLNYDENWNTISGEESSAGFSMELIDPLLPNEDYWNWAISSNPFGDYGFQGTPGSANSQVSDYGDPFVNEYSLEFDGEDDYIYITDNDELDLIDELTISAWIHPSESGNNIYRTFISKRDGSAGNYQLTLNNAAGANQGEFSFWNGSGTTVSSGYIPEMDDWTHVAVTISDGTNLSMYANGMAIYSTYINNAIQPNNGPFIIGDGNYAPENEKFLGYIDEVTVWDRALSQEEITQKLIEQTQLIPANEEGLIAYYPFDEGLGTTAYDASSNDHDGTIYGAEYTDDTPVTVYGCTDDGALNENPEANVEDGSCIYEPIAPTIDTTYGGSFSISLEWSYSGVVSPNNEITYTVYRAIGEPSDLADENWEVLEAGITATEYTDSDGLDFVDRRCYAVKAFAVINDLPVGGPYSEYSCARTNDCWGDDGDDCWESDSCAAVDDCQVCTGGNSGAIYNENLDLCGGCTNLISEDEINYCIGCQDSGAINSGSFTMDCSECGPDDGGNCAEVAGVCPCIYIDTWFVNAATGADDCENDIDIQCGSETYPLASIQEAINRAMDSNLIVVFPGTYAAISINKNVIIKSRYQTNEALIYQTIIDADSVSSAVTFTGTDETSSLKGFTITGGYAENGAGIHLINSNPILEKLVIHGNTTPTIGGKGGGIYCIGSSPTINQVTIADNFGTEGGGMYIDDNSTPSIINSIIWNNAPIDAQQIVFPDEGENISIVLQYSDVLNSDTWDIGIAISPVIEDVDNFDPLFSENYMLSSDSPCIDAGSPDYPDDDGSNPEMGAYSFEHTLGCTDSNACPGSYDLDATSDDGSCDYTCMTTWWVDDDAEGEEPSGMTQADPFPLIQTAIDSASAGDTVLVAPGTYHENLFVDKPLKIFSYFVTLNDSIYIDDTILDGSWSTPNSAEQSVIFFSYSTDGRSFNESQLSGFTIKGGTGTKITEECNGEFEDKYVGSAVFVINNSPKINSNIIKDNGKNGDEGTDVTGEGTLMAISDDDVQYRSSDNRDGTSLFTYDACNKAENRSSESRVLDFSNNRFSNNYARYGKSIVIEDNEGTTQVLLDSSHFDVFSQSLNTVSSYWVAGNEYVEFDFTDSEGDEDYIYDSEIIFDGRSEGLDSLLGKVMGSEGSPVTINLGSRSSMEIDKPLQMVNHVSIRGNGSEQTVITGSAEGNQLLLFKNVQGVHIDSLTLSGGNSKQGSAAYIRQSSPNFTDVTFKNNTAERGGAVFIMGGSPEFNRSTFEDNISSELGGGIYSNSSNPVIRESVIKGNRVEISSNTVYGGGIYLVNSNIILENDTLINNIAGGDDTRGGAIYVDNTNIDDPDRLHGDDSSDGFIIQGLVLSGNQADYGAGIYVKNAEVEIRRCQITGNVGETGAALYFSDAKVRIINSTISGNYSSTDAAPGGIYSRNGSLGLFVFNSIIWNNSSPQMKFDQSPTQLVVAYSNIGHPVNQDDNLDYYTNVTINPSLDASVLLTNISDDPLFITPIAPDGIPTIAGDFNLQTIADGYGADSPCINTGSAVFEWADEGDLIHLTASEFDGPYPDMGMYESGILLLVDCMDDGNCTLETCGYDSPYPGTEACNYEPEATSQCTDCCVYPAAFHDCSGVCLVDTDEDGICDEQEEQGCMDAAACNYSPTATSDNGSCLYTTDCFGICGGPAEEDECGVCDGQGAVYECGCTGIVEGECDCEGNVLDECDVCGGGGIADGECDCDGNVDLGCGCGESGPSGCDNQCGSTLENDECGVCGGNGECLGCMDDGNCSLETCGYDSPDPGESAHNYDPDADIDDGSCIYGPDIISIYDAPNDEGGQVYLNWSANSLDQSPNQVITRYSVWRYLPDENRGWQFLEYVDAYYFETYGVVAPTHGDSTSVGVPWTTYKVLAHTEDQWTFYPSEPDSGYSVDNLAPDLIAELQSEVIDTDVFLNWEESTAADLSHYNIYLNDILLTLTEQVDLFHESPPYAQGLNYRVSAVDVHENESILSEPTHQFILLSGDVNLDASVDVMDIVVLVDVIMYGSPLNDIQFIAADMNSDNDLNVIDIVMIVDEIIGESLSRTEGMEEISILYGNGIFTLEFKSVMAGIQCEVSGDYEINNVHLSEGWNLHENGSTLLLFAQDGSDINTNRPFDYVGELEVISCIATDWFFEPFMVNVMELPKSYSLSAAYPNPFNPVTRINFELPVDSHISMTIYNLQGRLITTLSDEIKSAGYHTITWNASQQASGIYFVKMYARDADMATIGMMTIESYLQIQKLMLVK